MTRFTASLAATFALAGFACADAKQETPTTATIADALHDECGSCPDPWVRPVCGEDGETWPSECEATCNNVPVAFVGDCSCNCWGQDDVVCGDDGQTYPSTCSAACMGAGVVAPGPCVCPDCPPDYELVCGADGVTYRNECVAWYCHGVEPVSYGSCNCDCPAEWDPICGVDGTTYGNRCRLDCAGVIAAHEGACPGGGPIFP